MSNPKVQDVLLVGLGAVGAVYSLILTRSGLAHVTVVARSNYDAVNDHGVHFKSHKYGEITGWRPDHLVRSVAEAADRPYSYVFLATKAVPERITTPSLLAPLLSSPYADAYPQPAYILLQNGLNVAVDLYHALVKLGKGEPRIISTATWIYTNLLEPNVVEHSNFENMTVGVYRYNNFTAESNTPAEASLLEDVASMLKAGGTSVTVVPEVQRIKFSKNMWNVAFSTVATLTSYPSTAIFRAPPTDPSNMYSPYVYPTTAHLIAKYTIPNIRCALQELIVLGQFFLIFLESIHSNPLPGRTIGYPDTPDGLPSSIVDTVIERTRERHSTPDSSHKLSMLIDMEKGQPIEVEVIVGEVVRMARDRGVEMPRVEMLYALLLVVQNQILRKLEENK
ncbi:hypothetical protein Hypma_009452 [Hypsizygus marmoreus]|uniref:2-dehydropantoate 2-reductase n=1 Tax=Hypsizygus marmoreus TaxID=39966 RepID=A0A369JR23_HYPMA|nr:hypothetical protein Hypma_009452 [Hypsizygus marmoreus]